MPLELSDYISTLSQTQLRVVTARFGGTSRALADVAGELGLSREAVRAIEVEAFSRMREAAERDAGRGQ